MKEERDFAGFVLAFAIGVFIATGSSQDDYVRISASSSLFLGASVMTVIALMRNSETGYAKVPSGLLTYAAGFFCGGFTGAHGMLADTGMTDMLSWLEELGDRTGMAIDMVCFSDRKINSIIKALITGDRNDIPETVTEAFRDSGASHILALSGFHLGIVYGIISKMLSWTGGTRKAKIFRSLAVILSCTLYTFSTGAGASISRALIFIILRETAIMTHRSTSTSSILLSAMLIQLTLKPSDIRSVSFQLSYAAMAGIAWIFPYLNSFWPESKKDETKQWPLLRKVWSSAALSVSCQLTTGTIAWFYFDSFPRHFLLTNLIAIPLTGIIIPLSLMTLILDTADMCPDLLVSVTEILVTSLSRSLEIIASM